jgi:tetratricopeptide (TPR) repeat protein
MPFPALALMMFFAAQGSPSSFEALSRQAEAARNSKDLVRALDLYRQALRLKPDWEDGLWSAGSIAYDLDRYSECSPIFHQMAEVKPASAPAWTMAGLCDYRLRHYEAALDSFAHVAQLKFDEPPELARSARLHYALLLAKTGRFEEAITSLTELTRVDRKSPETIVAAGIAGLRKPWLPAEVPEGTRELVYKLGDAMASGMEMDYKEADRKFSEVAAQFPTEPNVHFRFGAFLNMQDSDRGIQEIKKALELDPHHVLAMVSLAAIYLKREDPANALAYAERAVGEAPKDFSTHLELGRALLAKEEPAKAAAELETAARLAPENPDARYSLGTAYLRLGRKADAARELGEFKRLTATK